MFTSRHIVIAGIAILFINACSPNWIQSDFRPLNLNAGQLCSSQTPFHFVFDTSSFKREGASSWHFMHDNMPLNELLRSILEEKLRKSGCEIMDTRKGELPTLEISFGKLEYGGGHEIGAFIPLTFLGIFPGIIYAGVPVDYYVLSSFSAKLYKGGTTYWTATVYSQRVVHKTGFADREIFWTDGGRFDSTKPVVGGILAEVLEDSLNQVLISADKAFIELRQLTDGAMKPPAGHYLANRFWWVDGQIVRQDKFWEREVGL